MLLVHVYSSLNFKHGTKIQGLQKYVQIFWSILWFRMLKFNASRRIYSSIDSNMPVLLDQALSKNISKIQT